MFADDIPPQMARNYRPEAHMLISVGDAPWLELGESGTVLKLTADHTERIHFNTAPSSTIEFTADSDDEVPGRVELSNNVASEITACGMDASDAHAHRGIVWGVNDADKEHVDALARRLPNIRRRAPAEHRWSLPGEIAHKDAARVMLSVCNAIERLCLKL